MGYAPLFLTETEQITKLTEDVGVDEGDAEGLALGDEDGDADGLALGFAEGEAEGKAEGCVCFDVV